MYAEKKCGRNFTLGSVEQIIKVLELWFAVLYLTNIPTIQKRVQTFFKYFYACPLPSFSVVMVDGNATSSFPFPFVTDSTPLIRVLCC